MHLAREFLRLNKLMGSNKSIPGAASCKACVCGRSLAGIAVANLVGGMDVCFL